VSACYEEEEEEEEEEEDNYIGSSHLGLMR